MKKLILLSLIFLMALTSFTTYPEIKALDEVPGFICLISYDDNSIVLSWEDGTSDTYKNLPTGFDEMHTATHYYRNYSKGMKFKVHLVLFGKAFNRKIYLNTHNTTVQF